MTLRGLVAAGLASLAGAFSCSAVVAAAPRFSAPVFSPGEAFRIAVADVDGDGNPDVVGEDAGVMSVQRGRGDGRFRRPANYATGFRRAADNLVAVDVSGDGAPDAISTISTNYNRGWVVVRLNDGAGRFGSAQRYPTRSSMSAMVTVDVDSDGLVDVLTAHDGGGFPDDAMPELSVLLGTGDGRFGAAQVLLGGGAADVEAADVNGDGKVDAVLSSNRADRVALRLGNGDGTFGATRAFGPRSEGFDLAIADLNRDGKLDVAAGSDRRKAVYRLLGNGDGTFGAAATYPMVRQPFNLVIADLDGDVNADMAVNDLWDWMIAVRSGRSDGTFGKRRVLPWDTSGALVVSDVNRDGRPDLVTTGGTPNGESGLLVMLNWTGRRRPPCVAVPVEGWHLRIASRHVRRAGCRLGRVRYRYSRNVRRDRVIRQRPRYGAILRSRAPIHLVVSRGRRR